MDIVDWSILPDHVIVNIFSYLTLFDRFSGSQTCRSWQFAFCSPHLWKQVTISFKTGEDQEQLKFLDKFGKYIQSLQVCVNQELEVCRECACDLLSHLATVKDRNLQKFQINFIGINPCLYSGEEFIRNLILLFGPQNSSATPTRYRSLKKVDLQGLLVSFSGELLEILSANNPDLEVLNIQNNVLVCEVRPCSVLTLVKRCRKLSELYVFSCSCSEEVLLALTDNDRKQIQRLSIFCRREEKYVKDIPSTVWKKLVQKLPNLHVILGFDHTIELLRISEVMKPEIPVQELRLETATDLWNEVRHACRFYKNTLEKLIVKSPPSKNLRELDNALLQVAKECVKLRSLHVFYVLQKETVEKILELCPRMKENETYTLKFIAEPHPWEPGKDFW